MPSYLQVQSVKSVFQPSERLGSLWLRHVLISFLSFPLLQFPMSSIELILQKLKEEESKSRELKQVLRAADSKLTKMVDYNTFR